LDGGSYFGVPISNFMGWLLTTYIFFQLFALYLKGRRRRPQTDQAASWTSGLQAVLFYGLIAAGYVQNMLLPNSGATVTDLAGVVWRLHDIYAATGLVALFTMGTFTMLGLVKLTQTAPAAESVSTELSSGSTAKSPPVMPRDKIW
jgi:putative membrane protein